MKILIDNYNLSTHEYKEYHQELVDMTLDEVIDLLFKIPHKDAYPRNPVNVITEDFILLKITNEHIRIVSNITGLRSFPQLGDPFNEEELSGHKPLKYKISDNKLKSYISKETHFETTKRSRYRNLFLTACLPIINIVLIIFFMQRVILNIGTVISFSLLLFLSFFTIIYHIRLSYMKPVKFRKLRYEIPIIDKLKPIDISYFVISYGQCFYFFVFVMYSFYLDGFGIFWLVLILSAGLLIRRMVLSTILIISLYWRAKLAKELVEQRILEKYHSEEIKEKSYYLNLYSLVKSEKLIKMDLLSKLIVGITFVFTFIPILILPR